MADENKNQNQGQSNPPTPKAGDNAVKPQKKPKTPQQLEKERERRKRRRRKKSAAAGNVSGGNSAVLKADSSAKVAGAALDQAKTTIEEEKTSPLIESGQDVPLILPTGAGDEAGINPPKDVDHLEESVLVGDEPSLIEPLAEEKAENLIEQPEDEISSRSVEENLPAKATEVAGEAEQEKTLPEPLEEETVITEAEEKNEDISPSGEEEVWSESAEEESAAEPVQAEEIRSDQVESGGAGNQEKPLQPAVDESEYEEKYVDHEYEQGNPLPPPQMENAEESFSSEPVVVEPPAEKVVEEVKQENNLEQDNLAKAKALSDALAGKQLLDELPAKPTLTSKLFDAIQKWIEARKAKKTTAAETKIAEAKPTEPWRFKFKVDLARIWPILKVLLALVFMAGLFVGAFWLGSSLKLYDRVMDMFKPAPGQEQLAVGDNSKVVIDEGLMAKWGYKTALIFSRNSGNKSDLTYNVFFNSGYFGKLKEPVFFGETGITAALYYGFGKDAIYLNNRFIYYVKFLQKLQNAYSVNVYDVLDGKLRRDLALKQYLDDTQLLFEQGNNLRKEILVQVDDLTVSLNTLNPDKDRYETDFFASMSSLEAEKANVLIKKFVETAQKQVEIKAKLAALTKLAQYYEKVLVALKIRLEAVDKNQAALINGIQVTEIPGANLDLVKTP